MSVMLSAINLCLQMLNIKQHYHPKLLINKHCLVYALWLAKSTFLILFYTVIFLSFLPGRAIMKGKTNVAVTK